MLMSYISHAFDNYDFADFPRDDLNDWIEGRAIKQVSSQNVEKFLYEDIICRHEFPSWITLDNGHENFDLIKDLFEHYG